MTMHIESGLEDIIKACIDIWVLRLVWGDPFTQISTVVCVGVWREGLEGAVWWNCEDFDSGY